MYNSRLLYFWFDKKVINEWLMIQEIIKQNFTFVIKYVIIAKNKNKDVNVNEKNKIKR